MLNFKIKPFKNIKEIDIWINIKSIYCLDIPAKEFEIVID
jgi:hypothetical protein